MRKILLLMLLIMYSLPSHAQDDLCLEEQICFGTSLSPRSYESDDFVTFLNVATQVGTILYWSGHIEEIYDDEGAPYIVPQVARNSGFIPMVQFQVFDIETGDLTGIGNEDQNLELVHQMFAYAEAVQPEFLAFGVEVNILNIRNPEGFERYLTIYDRMIDTVKQASPNTQIVAILQYEQLIGYQGGLFGGENQPNSEGLELVEHFWEADIIGFTTYPGLVFMDPSEIPSDYYSPLLDLNHTIAFTEIGWQSDDSVDSGWQSSEEEQARFVEDFAMLTADLCPVMYLWSFVYDPATIMPFDSMGLRRDDGTERPAWDAWLALQDRQNIACSS